MCSLWYWDGVGGEPIDRSIAQPVIRSMRAGTNHTASQQRGLQQSTIQQPLRVAAVTAASSLFFR